MSSSVRIRYALFAAAALLVSCGSDSGTNNTAPPPELLELTATAAGFDLSSVDAEYFEAISYGPYDENLFDIYLPTSDEPTPLLIYIHGGGFTGGSRDTTGSEDFVMSYLSEGVAFATIDYRLLESPDPDGVIKSLQDSTRCLQFIRYHAEQLNIDPSNIILMGGSAGAGTSLWIGFNDDMADPDNEDPVLRQTTRVNAIIAIATQATYDIGKWKTVVFEEYNVDLLALADSLSLAQALLDFYGITDVDAFESPQILEYRARVDMLDLMDAEDPPFYVDNYLEPASFPITVDLAFHHANHALVLADRADEIGLENVAYMKALMIEDPSGEDSLGFASWRFESSLPHRASRKRYVSIYEDIEPTVYSAPSGSLRIPVTRESSLPHQVLCKRYVRIYEDSTCGVLDLLCSAAYCPRPEPGKVGRDWRRQRDCFIVQPTTTRLEVRRL
jgi:hypothetical protein